MKHKYSESLRLYNILNAKDPLQMKNVLSQDYCDVGPEFLGFVEIYKNLSKIIPRHFKVIDFGCAYGFQSYYFRDHSSYLGINESLTVPWLTSNSSYLSPHSIKDFLSYYKLRERTFAICSYVPSEETRLVRNFFPNVFVFYPEANPEDQRRIRKIMTKSKSS